MNNIDHKFRVDKSNTFRGYELWCETCGELIHTYPDNVAYYGFHDLVALHAREHANRLSAYRVLDEGIRVIKVCKRLHK